MNKQIEPHLLILNQMAGPMTWELAEDLGRAMGPVALLTGHPDTLKKSAAGVYLFKASAYQRSGYARRVLTWLLYSLQALVWLWRWPASVPMLLFSNPPILCWLGYLMFKLRGQRYAVMVHDIYPDVLVGLGKLSNDHWLARLWRALNRRAYEHARVVMTLGEYMAANLAKQFDANKTPAGQVQVVYPWVDTDAIKPIPKEQNWFAHKYNQVGKLTVMYSGNMGLGHDIETMLEAARQLQDQPEIHFMFIGAGPKWQFVADMIKAYHLKNVTLLPWQAEEIVPFSMTTADVALVSIERGTEGLMVPSKTFALLATGVALVAICSQDNELVEILTQAKCGWIVQPGRALTLSQIIRRALDTPTELAVMKKNGREIAETVGSRKNSSILTSLISSRLSEGGDRSAHQGSGN